MFYLNTAVMILLAVKAYCLKTVLANSSNTFSENKIITVAALRRLGKKLRSIFHEESNNVISLEKASQPPTSSSFFSDHLDRKLALYNAGKNPLSGCTLDSNNCLASPQEAEEHSFLLNFCCFTAECNEASDGRPVDIRHEIVTRKSVRVSWSVPDAFITKTESTSVGSTAGQLGDNSRYNVYLNNVLTDTVIADRKDLSTVLARLDMCQKNEVTLEAITDDGARHFTARTIVLDWKDADSVSATLSKFPDLAEKCGFCPNEDLTALCVFPLKLYDVRDTRQHCWEDDKHERALCRDVMNKTQHCNRKVERCFVLNGCFVLSMNQTRR
ncbi:uncharacterized protein LOC142346067 [Convolutriloba macropyga]|uniref:uncharacterized protein LOC142346067 n=1 Tax=Convolutriloba macropyga TaxID=536237 RepID=UPI003F51C511